jgi:tetratricopeptide (TPR) repeat protein
MAPPTSSEIREQLQRICESDTFRSAPQISRLLIFLTDATLEGKPLKESVIGSSFFARSYGYDSQADPVVRTEVRRLRLKLGEYYSKEGTSAPIVIEIPPGGYKAKFSMRDVSPPAVSPKAAVENPVAPAPPSEDRAPAKLPVSPRAKSIAAAVLLTAAVVLLLPRITGRSTATQRTVAVFRLRDLDGAGETAWLGNALGEMIATQLSGGDKLRTISLDDAARTRLALGVPDAVSLGPSELTRIRQNLGADLVVAGSYASIGSGESKAYRIDVQIYDAHTGQAAGSASETGNERTLFDMVSRVGTRIGRQVGVETTASPGALPLDAKGLSKVDLAKTLTMKADFLPNGPEKEALYRQALEIGRKESSGAWEVRPLNGLAQMSAGRRDFENAADFYRQSYEVSRKYYGPDHASTAETAVHWARSRTRIGEGKEAVEQIREAIPVARRRLPPDSPRLWNVLHDAIHACNEAEAYRDAESYTMEALVLNERMHLTPASERWGMLYWDLGRAKRGEKNYRAAIAALEKAAADLRQFPDTRTREVRADIEQVKAEQRGEVKRGR